MKFTKNKLKYILKKKNSNTFLAERKKTLSFYKHTVTLQCMLWWRSEMWNQQCEPGRQGNHPESLHICSFVPATGVAHYKFMCWKLAPWHTAEVLRRRGWIDGSHRSFSQECHKARPDPMPCFPSACSHFPSSSLLWRNEEGACWDASTMVPGLTTNIKTR